MSTLSRSGNRLQKSRHVLALVTIAALLVSACGGGGSASSSGSGSPAATSDHRTADQRAADQKTAEAIILKLSDFPPGWESKPRDSSASDAPAVKAAAQKFGQCLNVDPSLVTNQSDNTETKAQSDDFTDSNNLEAESSATLDASTETPAKVLSALQQPSARGCLRDFFSTALSYALEHPKPGQEVSEGVTIGNVEVGQVNLPDIRGGSVVYRLTIPVTAGITVKVFLDFVLAVKGRTGMSLTFQNVGDPFPQALEVQLSNTVIDRAPSS